MIEDYFVTPCPDGEYETWHDDIENDIETFMQNICTLIDKHFDMQATMLQILAKMCCIKYLDFGLKCFNTLMEQMKSSHEMQDMVQNVVRIEVINNMRPGDPTSIHVSLLRGLNDLV